MVFPRQSPLPLDYEFNNRVINLADSAYDLARTVFYGGIDCRRAAIIQVRNAGEYTTIWN
jgi:hypothetical protein